MNTSANDRQVGGSHYAAGLQHWDIIEDYGLGYLEGCATKYITRYRKKNGKQDLEKALHFTEKLREKHINNGRVARGIVPTWVLTEFINQNQLEPLDASALGVLCRWETVEHLDYAIKCIKDLLLDYN